MTSPLPSIADIGIASDHFGGQLPRGPQKPREIGLGSGVIVSPDGSVLPNNNVVEKATDTKVMLPDLEQASSPVGIRSQLCGEGAEQLPPEARLHRFPPPAPGPPTTAGERLSTQRRIHWSTAW